MMASKPHQKKGSGTGTQQETTPRPTPETYAKFARAMEHSLDICAPVPDGTTEIVAGNEDFSVDELTEMAIDLARAMAFPVSMPIPDPERVKKKASMTTDTAEAPDLPEVVAPRP
ncbi:hypothetical protein [Cucumibacter marinus]|uniref:hypothetical protein n=1 Tax=Cucumibacter marinus TaxID=1121252 RepID=UPI00041E17CA|nr:hypothetical protein [Cucumibacter marinus]